jgi:predicted metalloprotease
MLPIVRIRLLTILLLLTLLVSGPGVAFAQDKDPSGGQGGSSGGTTAADGATTYTSPTHGYSIAYDDTWSVTDETSEGGYDSLTLESDGSNLWIEGLVAYDGDVATCLDANEAMLGDADGVTAFDEIERDDSVGQARGSYAVTIEGEDGSGGDVGLVVECRTLVEGASVVVFTLIDITAGLDAEVDRFDAILDTFEVGEQTATTTTTGDTGMGGGDVGDLQATMENAAASVDAFWTSVFEAAGLGAYEPPQYVFYEDSFSGPCGDIGIGVVGSHYCPIDQTIYIDLPMEQRDMEWTGSFSPSFTVAHETGHHVQNLLDMKRCDVTQCLQGFTSLQFELMADCMAGAWTGFLRDQGLVSAEELEGTIVLIAAYLGDPAFIDSADPRAHGPGSLRTWWFLKGYYEGVGSCFAEGQF